MAGKVGKFTVEFDVKGLKDLTGLSKKLQDLQKSVAPKTSKEIMSLARNIQKISQVSPKTIDAFKKKERALIALRNVTNVNSRGFKTLTKEIARTRTELDKFTKTSKKSKGMFGGLGPGGKAAVGGFVGAAMAGIDSNAIRLAGVGGLAGGPKGALIGAVLGGTLDLAGAASSTATFASEIRRLDVALQGVTKTDKEFIKAKKVIASVSDDLNVPIKAASKQFTTLSASVIGAGGSVDDAELVFRGVSEAIKATGGDAEDVQSAIRAMSQIFGKGKVSAEELQGQLGERLPGAVVKFADATGRTLPQLQKDLRDGTVGLNDVMKFVVKLSDDHAEAAKAMADSTADAGQRMKVALDKLRLSFGEFFQPVGAGIQNIITELANMVNATITAGKMMDILQIRGGFNKRRQELVNRAREEADLLAKERGLGAFGRAKLFDERFRDLLQMEINKTQDPTITGKDLTTFQGVDIEKTIKKATRPLQAFKTTVNDIGKDIEQTFVNAFQGMEDALVKFVETGKLNFSDLARSIISDLTRMLVRAAVTKPLFNFLFPNLADGGVVNNGELVKSANGNVFAKNKIVPYAMGGIVNKPTLFPMANGMGLMGEAGPEAVMPLKRGANGKLGVQSSGGVGNIVVNVDASGSSIEGDSAQGEQFGRALAAAIQSELIQQKRPGGLLS